MSQFHKGPFVVNHWNRLKIESNHFLSSPITLIHTESNFKCLDGGNTCNSCVSVVQGQPWIQDKKPEQKLTWSAEMVWQHPAAGFWNRQRMGLHRLHACVIGHTDRCVLLTINDTVQSSSWQVPTIPTFSGNPLLPVSFHLSSTTMHFPMAVILPASQSGPCLHGDGVSKPLLGTSTLEIYCFLGLLPSLPLCRCQCVVHWKNVKSMRDTEEWLQLCSEFYTWIFGFIVQSNTNFKNALLFSSTY